MQGGAIVKLARMAAALSRNEWAARVAARRPMRNYRGVHHRRNRYYSVIWNIHTRRQLWLRSYKTPEEAAYAWDAAARVTRGRHCAKPNFPEPAAWAWAAAAAREEVSTELVLALPTPAVAPKRCDPAAVVAAQVSFDNWLLSASAALPPFSHLALAGPTTAAAANNGGAAVVNPSNPGAYVLTPQNVQTPPTNPASTSSEPVVLASQFLSGFLLPPLPSTASCRGLRPACLIWPSSGITSPTTVRPRLLHLLQCLGSRSICCCNCLVAPARVGRSKERQKLPQVPTGC